MRKSAGIAWLPALPPRAARHGCGTQGRRNKEVKADVCITYGPAALGISVLHNKNAYVFETICLDSINTVYFCNDAIFMRLKMQNEVIEKI